jgi:hypothetical protein
MKLKFPALFIFLILPVIFSTSCVKRKIIAPDIIETSFSGIFITPHWYLIEGKHQLYDKKNSTYISKNLAGYGGIPISPNGQFLAFIDYFIFKTAKGNSNNTYKEVEYHIRIYDISARKLLAIAPNHYKFQLSGDSGPAINQLQCQPNAIKWLSNSILAYSCNNGLEKSWYNIELPIN